MQGVTTKGKQSWTWWLKVLFLVFLVQVFILYEFATFMHFVRSTLTSTKVPKQNLQPLRQVWQICKVWMHGSFVTTFLVDMDFEALRVEEVLSRHGPRQKRPLWSVLLATIVEMRSNLQMWIRMKSFSLDIDILIVRVILKNCMKHSLKDRF